MSSINEPQTAPRRIHRAAILFAGGPAPAANAVISTAAISFLRNNVEVIGIRYGYSQLVRFTPGDPLREDRDYLQLNAQLLRRTRNTQGVLIGTARTNPGKEISRPSHLKDANRVQQLKTVYDALCSLQIDALVSIGGDDTLKTANKLKLYQDTLPPDCHRFSIVHVPKTIDNDYHGIDFTFGYFTSVEAIADEIRNLLADAEATRSYYLVETMGRRAGWLAYGSAIAGEASLVLSVEDIDGRYRTTEKVPVGQSGKEVARAVMNLPEVVARVVGIMKLREDAEKKKFGVIVVAEGLAEYLPYEYLKDAQRDDHGNLKVGQVHLGRILAELIAKEYHRQTGSDRRITPLQLGYEARCARPHAFDVLLGSQLGVGAYRALVEKRLNGIMVSVSGQLELRYVPFEQLVNPETLVTLVRYMPPGCDFQRLARFLETYVNEAR